MGTQIRRYRKMPLLVSVRSGARDSMPGMMDTILNLGMNDETVLALAGHEERAFRVGLLPPFHPDVWRRRDGRAKARRRRPRAVRNSHRAFKHETYQHDIDDSKLNRRRLAGARHAVQDAG